MDNQRRPLRAHALPVVEWEAIGKRVKVDPSLIALLGKPCYRYATIAEFVSLSTGSLTFAHPRTWPDKYECHLADTLFGKRAPFSKCTPFIKCFSLEYSSDAMWKTYAGPGGLIRVGINLMSLIESLNTLSLPREGKIYIGRARYMKQPEWRAEIEKLTLSRPKNVTSVAMRALLMKRAGFSFENEIRVAFLPSAGALWRSDHMTGAGFDPSCIGRALLDPYLPKWQVEQLETLFSEYLRVPFAVEQSKFDEHPSSF